MLLHSGQQLGARVSPGAVLREDYPHSVDVR